MNISYTVNLTSLIYVKKGILSKEPREAWPPNIDLDGA
jgi:hypothetical protein